MEMVGKDSPLEESVEREESEKQLIFSCSLRGNWRFLTNL